MKALSTTLLLLGLCVGLAPSLRATTSFTTTVTSGPCQTGAQGQGSNGNTRCFIDSSNSSFTVMATAWSTTGGSGGLTGTLQSAALGEYGAPLDYGLGVCNQAEWTAYSTCSSSGASPEHPIDNNGNVDFVLLQFSQPISSISLTLSPFGQSEDMDATYISGLCSGSCTTANFLSALTGGTILPTQTSLDGIQGAGTSNVFLSNFYTATKSTLDVSTGNLNLSGNVNWILIGASTSNDAYNDFFKLKSMDFTVGSTTPEPATFVLAGSALLGLGLLRARKKKRSEIV